MALVIHSNDRAVRYRTFHMTRSIVPSSHPSCPSRKNLISSKPKNDRRRDGPVDLSGDTRTSGREEKKENGEDRRRPGKGEEEEEEEGMCVGWVVGHKEGTDHYVRVLQPGGGGGEGETTASSSSSSQSQRGEADTEPHADLPPSAAVQATRGEGSPSLMRRFHQLTFRLLWTSRRHNRSRCGILVTLELTSKCLHVEGRHKECRHFTARLTWVVKTISILRR